MSAKHILRIGSLHNAAALSEHIRSLRLNIPCDGERLRGAESPIAQPIERGGIKIGNRIAIHPMEGWDGTAEGKPTEYTIRRWRRFGESGAKLIWGGEAVAVRHEGRANPNQLLASTQSREALAALRSVLVEEHVRTTGSDHGLLIGLQLTHSGRYSKPNAHDRPEPGILYHHPILDRRLKLAADYPLMSDGEIESIIEDFHRAARMAWEIGFAFVDIKHCHGYLGHEFLSAHTRAGKYGGSFENRTRFLREIVQGVRSVAPGLKIGVRLSAFDVVPFRSDPAQSAPGTVAMGIPEEYAQLIPYRWGFGMNSQNPIEWDLTEPIKFLSLLENLDIRLVNLTAGSPYYNPHLQRPAIFPPSDGYSPPHDPLVEVARQMECTRELKRHFPQLIFVGTGYTYFQDFLPNVAQAAIRDGWADLVGLGRMVLSYPGILWDAVSGHPLNHKLVCRTFSDCTTAPRNGLQSGCYPLDGYYRQSEMAVQLKAVKAKL
jgi:NADPH2 dehydrogenase